MVRAKPKGIYRSTLEDRVIAKLKETTKDYVYEGVKLKYQKKPSVYTPDLILSNGIIIEVKGYFDAEDRAKHLLVLEQHPSLEIRFVFQAANKKIHKSSPTTYEDWCDKYGFKHAIKEIPVEWIQEKGNVDGQHLYREIGKKVNKSSKKKE